MNKRIQLAIRNAVCDHCSMAEETESRKICVTAQGNHEADLLIVTKFPMSDKAREALIDQLKTIGFNPKDLAFTGAVKCASWESSPTKSDIKECKKYLDKEISFIKPKYILAMGNEALLTTLGHSGIMKWRGRLERYRSPHHPHVPWVMPTIALAAVARNPSQAMYIKADFQYLYNKMYGIETEGHEPKFKLVHTKERLRELVHHLKHDTWAASFDIESNGFNEHDPGAFLVSLAITTITHDSPLINGRSKALSDASMTCWVIPLCHRASRWQTQWIQVLNIICKALRLVPRRIAHNAKFDSRWLEEFGVGVQATFCTMIASHLLDENRQKGLKPLARIILGAPEWEIPTSSGKNAAPWYEQKTLKEILKYNGLDTWHTMRLYLFFRRQLEEQPRIKKIFTALMMPASRSMVHVERRGVWADKQKLLEGSKTTQDNLADIDAQLMEWVNEDDIPPNIKGVNFGPSNFLRWWLYEYLELPITKRGKKKENGDPGNPSVAEDVLSHLKDHHPVIPVLLERVKWRKYETSFFRPYLDQLTEESRIHTTFKLTGTVTGRLSSGKADLDKVTGSRQTRGVNLQQVPRDALVRGCFGAPPGWAFVEADYSQIELRIAAHIAEEPTMLMLYASGQDIHMAMAMRMTGKPASQITKHERKMAKAVNFGFLYGMGWFKFIETAWNNYGIAVSEEDAKGSRRAFFDEFPKLIPWHARQRRLAHKFKRVESPIGRVRHLPDIISPDQGVRAEAERQAINSPVQAMASDLTLLSMVLIDKKLKKQGFIGGPIGTVHDAVNFEFPEEELPQALPLIKDTMENPPLEQLFGVSLKVPIIADLAVGKYWGGARELSEEEVYNYQPSNEVALGSLY